MVARKSTIKSIIRSPLKSNLLTPLYLKSVNNSTTEREVSTMYYTQEQIDRANQADLVSFLQSQGEQLTRAGNEYRWKRHDSLTVRGNKWYRHSQSKGGGPVDFVMEFFGKSFTEAVELLTGEKGAVPPPDRPCPASLSDFRLPPSRAIRFMFFLFKSIGTPSSPMVGHFTGNGWKSQSFGSGTWGMPREERKKTALTVWLGLFGARGGT